METSVDAGDAQISLGVSRSIPDQVTIHLDEHAILDIAEIIAREQLTREECTWLLANMCYCINRALTPSKQVATVSVERLPCIVMVSPVFYDPHPPMDKVERGAKLLEKSNLLLKELYYRLAQRLYLVHFLDNPRSQEGEI